MTGFIDQLRRALSGKVDGDVIEEHVSYYEKYIVGQMSTGKTQEQVLEELGDPRLIAKSIIAATQADEKENEENIYEEESGFGSKTSRSGLSDWGVKTILQMPSWLVFLIFIGIIFLVVSIVFSLLSFVAPILIPALLIIIVINLIGQNKKR